MKVAEAMTRDVLLGRPDASLRDIARLMSENDVGVVPIGDNDRLVGMITDRDLTVRGLAEGKGPGTPVREIMSETVKYCFEDEELDVVARTMGELQMRRLPVLDRNNRLVGIVSLGDIAANAAESLAGEALRRVSEPL